MSTPNIPSHMTRLPPGFITVRIIQLIAATVGLALSAFEFSVLPYITTVVVLIIVVLTWVILVWIVVSTYMTPKAYNYWAVLAMEIFMFVAWIITFVCSLADAFNGADALSGYCSSTYNRTTGRYTTTCYEPSTRQKAYGISTMITCAMAGILMVLFFVSMVVMSVFIARHRRSGGHNIIGSEFTAPVVPQGDLRYQQQNVALQQQVLALQQKQFEMERHLGIVNPPASVAALPGQPQMSMAPSGSMPQTGHEAQAQYQQPRVQSPVSTISAPTPQMAHRDLEAQHQQQDAIEPAPKVVYA